MSGSQLTQLLLTEHCTTERCCEAYSMEGVFDFLSSNDGCFFSGVLAALLEMSECDLYASGVLVEDLRSFLDGTSDFGDNCLNCSYATRSDKDREKVANSVEI